MQIYTAWLVELIIEKPFSSDLTASELKTLGLSYFQPKNQLQISSFDGQVVTLKSNRYIDNISNKHRVIVTNNHDYIKALYGRLLTCDELYSKEHKCLFRSVSGSRIDYKRLPRARDNIDGFSYDIFDIKDVLIEPLSKRINLIMDL